MRNFYCSKVVNKMSDFNQNSLSEIVKLIKTKKVSSLEVTNHFIKNIEKEKIKYFYNNLF